MSENRTFDELHIGDSAERALTLEPEREAGSANDCAVTSGMWGEGLISSILATQLPGAGTVYRQLSLRFRRPAAIGQVVIGRVRVVQTVTETREVTFDCECVTPTGEILVEGQAHVIAPSTKVRLPSVATTAPAHIPGARYRQLVEAAKKFEPIRTAIVHPCDVVSLASAMGAMKAGLVVPVLIGPEARIRKAADDAGCDIHNVELIDAPHSHAAAQCAVDLGRESKVDALMKGSLHTDELMAAVVEKGAGLRTERRMSHVFALDVPHYPKPLFITDAAVNIVPDLETKRDIVQNAIYLLHALAISTPKVAILSAVETVSSQIHSTVDAAALCKMAERHQIVGGVLDGPLAFDNAISSQAARTKGIVSPVAGEVDILVVPDLEAGNMLVKQLIYLAGAQAAGIVLGARIPVILTSRADGEVARLASCALAQLLVRQRMGQNRRRSELRAS